MEQQEEDEAHKSTEKEQQVITSTLTGKALIFFRRFLSLNQFIQSSISQNLAVASKVTTLAMDIMFFFKDCLLHIQAVSRVTENNDIVYMGYHYTNLSKLGMICTNILMNSTERITNRATVTANFSGLPTYDL